MTFEEKSKVLMPLLDDLMVTLFKIRQLENKKLEVHDNLLDYQKFIQTEISSEWLKINGELFGISIK